MKYLQNLNLIKAFIKVLWKNFIQLNQILIHLDIKRKKYLMMKIKNHVLLAKFLKVHINNVNTI